MNTLYNKLNETDNLKKEIRNIEKHISKHINQRNIKKYLLKGLKENIDIQNEIDNKLILLKRDIILDKDYNYDKYIFSIREQNNSILTIEILPNLFKLYFKVNVLSFQQDKITSEKIITYLKTIIGL